MTSLADLKTTLYSALSSGGDVAAEQELYEDLMAHKPTLVNVFNVGPRNPQEQKEIESGKILVNGRQTAVNTEFARHALFVSQQLECSERHVSGIMYEVMSSDPNVPPERLIELTILEYHRRRRQTADCIRYLFEAAELATRSDAPPLFHRLDQFVRQHLLPSTKPTEPSLPTKLFKEVDNLGFVITRTITARQNAGSETLAPPNQGGRLGHDILTAQLESLKYERRALATALYVIGRMGCLAAQDVVRMVEWLQQNPKHPMIYYILPTVLATFDIVHPDTEGARLRRQLISDKSFVSDIKKRLDIPTQWSEPGLKSSLLLKWTLFCAEARHRDPSLEDTDGFKSNELETQIWNAIQGDCFMYLTKVVLTVQRSQGDGSLAPNTPDQDSQQELPPVEFTMAIFEAFDILIRSLITHASSELRKIKQRQEDLLLANARTDRSRTWRSSVPQPEQEKTESPRNDMAVMFTFMGILYSALPPDTALPYWGVAPRSSRFTIYPDAVSSKLPSFLQWAVWSTPSHDLGMLTSLYSMLTGLANGEQCSELAYNFLAKGGGEGGMSDPSSSTHMMTGAAVSWSAMFGLLESWSALGTPARPSPPAALNNSRPFGQQDVHQAQQHAAHAHQQQQRLSLGPLDVLLAQAFLRLLATVVKHSVAARIAICGHARFRAIPTLMSLIPLHVPLELKGSIFDTISAFCEPGAGSAGVEICKSVWTLMERLEIINVRGNTGIGPTIPAAKGVEVELEEVEATFKMYPATIAFLKLLSTLLHTSKRRPLNDQIAQEPIHTIPENLGHPYRPLGIAPYTSFVVDNVFANIPRREYLRPSDRWQINDLCLCFVERCLASFDLEALVTSVENNVITREVVLQYAIHPGYDIMKRLLTHSPLQASILSYVVEGTDGFEKGLADEEPFFRSTIIRVLRILHRVLEIQDIFLDVLTPLFLELGDTSSIGEIHPASYFVRLDQALLFAPEIASAIVSYIVYPSYVEIPYLAVKLLGDLSTPATVYQLAVILDRSSDSLRILDGFRSILDMESSADVEDAETIVEQNTGAGAVDPRELDGDCIQAVRTAILDFFVQNTRSDRSYPNVAHFLLFGRVETGDQIQDPHALNSRRTSLHSIIDLLNLGIPRANKKREEHTPLVQPLLLTSPVFAERCYHIIYQLCKHPRTSDFTSRYLRSREDFFTRHLLAIPFKAPTIVRDPYIEVLYRDGSRVITTVPAFASFLRLRSWILDLIALELHILTNKGHHKTVSELLELLFGNAGDSVDADVFGWEFKTFQEVGQSHIRMIEYLESLDVDWSDSLTAQPIELEFLAQLDLRSCLRPDASGCEVVDRSVLVSLLVAAKRAIYSQGRILTSVHAQQLEAEVTYILQSCAVENHRREIHHAIAHSYEAWRRVLDVSLLRCYSRIPDDRRENMLLDLLHALPSALNSDNISEATAVILAESTLTAITKLREDRRTTKDIRSLPAERLYSLLKSLLGCITDHSRYELVRGNLYASLIQYLRLVTSTESSADKAVMSYSAFEDEELRRELQHPGRSREADGSLAIIQPVAEKLVAVIARDAIDGAEVWKTVAFVLLDSLVNLSLPQQTIVTALARTGYLAGFVQSVKESDSRLQAVLQPEPDDLDALYVYEAKMSLFIRMAQNKIAAERLLDVRLLHVLANCEYIDARPEVGSVFSEQDSFLPGAMQRYHQLLIPALQVTAAVLFTLGTKHASASQQGLQFLRNHRDTLVLLLKSEIDQTSLTSQEIHLIVALCAYGLQNAPRTELLSSSGFGGLYNAARSLANKRLKDQEWWQDLLKDPKSLD
ncbi:hypothetical protein K474DRAFT_1600404 [Panus rudis PR-1116 ss-1]|nr:hypothetical protein K474DRAFT_1600404 [Panus rudis PR-1116 ss-1]